MADVKIPKMLGSMSHTYQKAWYKKNKMELPAHLQRASSAGKVDTTRTKQAQQQSLKAYGATKGTRTGSAEGTGEELKDTVKPLTPEQHAKINAAKRASEGKPLTKDQRMSIIARSVRKAQAKHDVPTLDNNDAHNDVRHDHDLMHAVGVRHSYNEGFDPSPAEVAKMLVDKHGPNVTKDHIKELEDKRDTHGGLDHEEIMKHVKKMTEEVESVDEANMRFDYEAAARPKSSDVKNFLNRNKNARAAAASKKYIRRMTKLGGLGPNQTKKDTEAHMKAHFEEVVIEGAKEDAEKLLGGPVKTRTGNEPKGKLPLGFRQARNLARQAMKAGKSVTESTAEVTEVNEMSHGKALAKMIMAKQSKHPVAQHMGEAKDPGEYDYEGDMAMSQLKSVIANAQKLHDMMEPDTNLPEWVQAKITLAEDYIVTAANYMDGQMDESAFAELDAELELFEKAPPGSKYERMVKHIKAGYAKGGLTPKEKSIAYATAWKAYNKANEEVEGLDEDYQDTYHKHMNAHFDAANAGDWEKAEKHARTAEKAAAMHFKETGKKIYDPGYTGKSKHIGMREEAEQIDELKKSTLKSYVKKASSEMKKAHDYHQMRYGGRDGTDQNYMKNVYPKAIAKYDRRDAGVEKAKQKLAKEEVVTEAEGSIPTTPKEKELAAHHGDPNRITFGDVLKARLKSAAAKKMGK